MMMVMVVAIVIVMVKGMVMVIVMLILMVMVIKQNIVIIKKKCDFIICWVLVLLFAHQERFNGLPMRDFHINK